MKKYVLILLIVLIAAAIWTCINIEALKAYTQVGKGEFQITYILENGFKGYDIETQIFSDGSFIKTTSYVYDTADKIEEGHYSKNEVVKFVKYAIRHNIFKMNDNMNDKPPLDAANVFFVIRIGEKSIRAGGCNPQSVSNNFKKILKKFSELSYRNE